MMKRAIVMLMTILLLVGCGGEPLAEGVGETAVSQPVAAETVAAPLATAVADPAPDSGMMADMNGGMGGGLLDKVASQIDAALGSSAAEAGVAVSADASPAVQLLAAIPEVAEWLANYPDWTADAWPEGEDGRYYTVDLYSAAADEWLGWGYVNVADGVVEDYFVPRELTAEEFQTGREQVEAFVFGDEEVLARLGNVDDWGFDTWYNRWEANWQVWFWYGLEEMAVTVSFWEDEPYLESIENPAELAAEEAAENSKNQAIELAWQAAGIDQALAGVDNWQTYVAQQGETVWAVTFATEDRELFFALVDIESWTVLESN